LSIFFPNFFSKTLLYERKSLIILDEIQKCPEAREKIKYFVEYGKYDFIETGSLLSIKQNVKDITIPSEETTSYMGPLDFEEFLWAKEEDLIIPIIKEHFSKLIPLDNGIRNKLMLLFREYMLVGGMPQAVNEFIKSKDFIKSILLKEKY
jgi:predicted AAA+ superfamily ATPase